VFPRLGSARGMTSVGTADTNSQEFMPEVRGRLVAETPIYMAEGGVGRGPMSTVQTVFQSTI
jgi:hypothetical protein